jgi:pSer/pThr/pTyr-binding forkhead associated (FHA) protein
MFDVNGEITIGRAAGCGVSLPDDTFVSNVHARVYERDGDIFVEDLGSTNGSLVNGAALTAATKLRKGDRIQVGQTVLEATR